MTPKFDDLKVRHGVEQVLKNHNLNSKKIRLISGGSTNILYEVETQKGSLMVRVEQENTNRSEITGKIMRNLSQRGIIPNKFIELDLSKRFLNRNVIITEKLEGTQFLREINRGAVSNSEIRTILRAAIQNCLKISEQRTTGFGRAGIDLQGPLSSEKIFVSESLHRFLEHPELKKQLGETVTQRIKDVFHKNSHLFDCQDPRLVYIDFHFRNIIIQHKQFQSLIDFDYFVSGDPLLMLARLALRTMENDPAIKRVVSDLLEEQEVLGERRLKLRLFTIWIALVRLYYTAQGEIEDTLHPIRGYADLPSRKKLELLLDFSYPFF